MTFVTVLRSGGVYSPVWVERLHRQALEHVQPDRIVCLSDASPHGLEQHVHLGGDRWRSRILEPLIHDWPGWFAKMELFRPGLFAGDCLYVDLDSLILRPIPDLRGKLAKALDACPLALLDDFFSPSRPATGVIAWRPCAQTERLYHEFVLRPVCRVGWQHGDGSIVGKYAHCRLQTIFPGAFQSWKVQQRKHEDVTASVLCFHGVPKCDGFPSQHWITNYWVGANQ